MEQGPFRMPRPAGGAANKPEPASRPKEEPQPVKEEPKPVVKEAVTTHHALKETKRPARVGSRKNLKKPLLALVSVVILASAGWFAWTTLQGASTGIDATKYQAVFFTNGQVYFGKLHTFNNEYMKLSDIYYLQTQSGDQTESKNPQKSTTDQNNVQLIKLGDEIHGPEDEMVIAKDQVLFYENLKPKGKVAQSIAQFKKSD